MDYVIAIPSYQRPQKLAKQTLSYLRAEQIPKEKIYVFVANRDEYDRYRAILDPDTYGHLIVGVLGIAEQRSYINAFFPYDTCILSLDDDIKKIKMVEPMPLDILARGMFALCQKENVKMWSIYPVNNLYWAKDRIAKGKLFCVGCVCGEINTRMVIPPISACEDKYRSLYHYVTYGATLVYQGAVPDTVYFAKGGLTDHRKTKQRSDTEWVVNHFADHCVMMTKKSGVAECHWRNLITHVWNHPNQTLRELLDLEETSESPSSVA